MSPLVRPALPSEIPELRALVERSFRALAAGHYEPQVIEAALRSIIRIDPELIAAGTYFVVEREGGLAGCGGWSDQVPTVQGLPMPVPRAEVRAMFVAPEHAGSRVGSALLRAAETAIAAAGYGTAHLVATRSGREFFSRAGYRATSEQVVTLPTGEPFELTCMEKALGG